MTRFVYAAAIAFLITVAAPAAGWGQADTDSLRIVELVAAESAVDSLRAEIRKLDRDIQSMKQDYADIGDVDRLLEALVGPDALDPDAPADTRSRRHRVDSLLKAITQRPGQLRFNGSATMVAQDLVGGEIDGAAGTGSFDLYAHTSFGPSTLLFFAFEAGGGEGLDGFLPLATPLNGDAAPTRSFEGFDHLILNEAWAEFTALGEAVTFSVGKIDLTNYFDINAVANDETAQFLSGAFVNSAALLVPPPGPGLRARTVLLHRFSLQAGLVSADSTGGTRFRDAFAIGSFSLRLFPDPDREGNLRAYLYAPAHVSGATGWGLTMDQKIAASLVGFGRCGRNDAMLVTDDAMQSAWSAGLRWERPRRNREFALAAAYGEAHDADDAVVKTFETYASWQINTWTYVSPHLQIVRHDARMARAATVLGIRVQFNF